MNNDEKAVERIIEVHQKPHTLRLLRLIRDGTIEHAEEAAAHLCSLSATFPPLQLWDILGRLQENLSSSTWKTRSNAAIALEGVAKHLPVQDQIEFLTLTNSKEITKTETETTYRRLESSETKTVGLYLTVDNLLDEEVLDKIIMHGRLLMSTSENLYDISEDKALEDLDRQSISYATSAEPDTPIIDKNNNLQLFHKQCFVENRIRLQRKIMAQRLGLSDIIDIIGDTDILMPPDSVTSHDLNIHTHKLEASSKRRKIAEKIQQRKKQNLKQDEIQSSVRALLIIEIERSNKYSKGNAASHRSPQKLLANELIYRVFDPRWYIRHGALLGILSLLRSWRGTIDLDTSKSAHDNLNDAYGSLSPTCGTWPQDILARCICILVLDRFGDFSGAFVEDIHNSALTTGSVIAPVREVAGQLITLLLAMSSEKVKNKTVAILQRLAQNPSEWEVRHGALIALKFISSVLTRNSSHFPQDQSQYNDERSKSESKWCMTFKLAATKSASACLSDKSDDVKSVAASILVEIIKGLDKHEYEGSCKNDIFLEDKKLKTLIWDLTANPLWNELLTARSVSSSIIDLVTLFSLMMEYGGFEFLSSILVKDVQLEIGNSLSSVTKVQLQLLESEFPSVRASALRSIGSLTEALSQIQLCKDEKSVQLLNARVEAFTVIIPRLFDLFYAIFDDAEHDDKIQVNLQENIWLRMTNSAKFILGGDEACFASIELLLIKRYFHINCNKDFTYTGIKHHVRAANVFAQFVHSCRRADSISNQLETALRIFINSPCTAQCEATCILYRALSKQFEKGSMGLQSFQVSLDSLHRPLSLHLIDAQDMIRVRALSTFCYHIFVELMVEVTNFSRTPLEVAVSAAELLRETVQRELSALLHESTSKTTLRRMRVESTVAGAILTVGLPTKITPVVRALMTSFSNEFSSNSRQIQTCVYLTDLLMSIRKKKEFENALNKIISTLCERAVLEGRLTEVETSNSKPATIVLRGLIRDMTKFESLDDMPALYNRLVLLRSPEQSSDKDVANAHTLVRVVCGGLVNGRIATFRTIDTFLPYLIKDGCLHCSNEIRQNALSTVEELCDLNPGYLLQKALPVVATYIVDGCCRLTSCQLLHSIVRKAGKNICPYIRSLLPIVLSLVTDVDSKCAETANSLFALLVQFAPLVEENHSISLNIGSPNEHTQKVVDHLIFGRLLPLCTLPKDIDVCLKSGNVELRKYQMEGISWLRFLQSVNVNGALCDHMGLGKTVQALVALALAHNDKENAENFGKQYSLVVCPSSVVGHWIGEIEKCFPDGNILSALSLTGNSSVRQCLWSEKLSTCNVVVTSYSVLRSDIEKLKKIDWCYCILDEGHLLKNPKTATSRAAKCIKASHRLILTGTPIQNKVNEVWATFDFLMPNFLGSSRFFSNEFATPIAKSQMPNATASCIAEGISKLKILHQKVLPFILRREKDQVLPELPSKSIMTVRVPMTSLQNKLYNEFCSRSEVQMSLKAMDEALQSDATVNSDTMSVSNHSMKSLLFLRLLCTHPYLVLSDKKKNQTSSMWLNHALSGKMLALAQLLQEAGLYDDVLTAADNDSSVLYCEQSAEETDVDNFSQISSSGDGLGPHNYFPKLSSDSKCLIFAQFTRSLDLVEEILFKKIMPSLRYLRLDGSVPSSSRTEIVTQFNKDPSITVLLLTTRVGGLGLNLTSANMVILLEADYNPFADLQAMDRTHRIGQLQAVNVYRIVTQNSIEEKIMKLQEKKIAMSDAIINTDNSTLFSMGTDRLLDVFTFDTVDDNLNTSELNNDFDGLLDSCGDDYASLSVAHFTRSLD